MTGRSLSATIVERRIDRPSIEVTYPEVTGLKDREVQERINQFIRREVDRLISVQGGDQEDLGGMSGDYRVTLNEKGILSIRFENLTYIQMAAHPTTMAGSLTVNLKTGESYSLGDLFRADTDYRIIIRNMLRKQIKDRDIMLFSPLDNISDNQSYYLTEDAVVIYFQEAEIAPRVFGILEFPIPYANLANVINEEGPLGRFV